MEAKPQHGAAGASVSAATGHVDKLVTRTHGALDEVVAALERLSVWKDALVSTCALPTPVIVGLVVPVAQLVDGYQPVHHDRTSPHRADQALPPPLCFVRIVSVHACVSELIGCPDTLLYRGSYAGDDDELPNLLKPASTAAVASPAANGSGRSSRRQYIAARNWRHLVQLQVDRIRQAARLQQVRAWQTPSAGGRVSHTLSCRFCLLLC